MRHRIYETSFASVYPLYVKKAERKNRRKADVDQIIFWLTGYDRSGLQKQLKAQATFEVFFAEAPRMNPLTSLVTGVVCGVRVEEVKEPLMRKIRVLDKLVDELAKGKALAKILRATEPTENSPSGTTGVDKFFKNLKSWQDEASALRAILLKTGLNEELKWRLPCYTFEGKNIVIVQPFKNCLGLMYFKGALLKDPKKALVENGPNSQSSRRLEFRSIKDVARLEPIIKVFVKEAVQVEASGRKIEKTKRSNAKPAELLKAFAKNPKLKKAFTGLTPGRQRAYLLHFSGAKQTSTREARVAKCAPRILAGKGLTDR